MIGINRFMRILFINALKYFGNRIYREYPLGIGLLATIVQNAGHIVKICDMAVEEISITEIVSNYKPDIIGISFSSICAYTAYKLIENIKK